MISQPTLFPQEDNSRNSAYLLIVFLLWPFFGLILACANIKKSLNRKVIIAFFSIYGLLFFINPLMDGQRRADHFKVVHQEPFSNLLLAFDTLYDETLDVVDVSLMYIVSRVSDFYGVLFAVYAFLFGSLMLYYISKMHGHYSSNRNINALLFFILLICVNPISNINGFRMWMAAWVFAVGILNYLHKPSITNIVFAALAILIHFSFLPAAAMLALYVIFRNKPVIYGTLAIITFFVAELNIEQVKTYAAFLGTASETKVDAYTNEQHIEKVLEYGSQSAWYIDFINNGLKYFTFLSLILIFYKTRGKFKNEITANFYSFTLLFLCFANISALLPSGGRFYTVFYIFAFSALLLYYIYETEHKKVTIVNRVGIPVVALYAVFAFRLFSDSASGYLFGPSFIMPMAFFENVSLKSLIF